MSGSVLSVSVPAIAPSILTADFGRLRGQIQEAESAGVDLLHLDVMDGHFVPNISFGPLVVSSVRKVTNLPLDVHLMIERPERYIDAFAEAGADIMSVHVEATPHIHRAIEQIRSHGVDAGVAINPGTSLSTIESVLMFVDLVLVMSVNPGFGGQSFIPESEDRISHLRSMLLERGLERVRIEVDGGIKQSTIGPAYAAGAELFVTGSSVFNEQSTVSDAVSGLRSALNQSGA